MARYIKKPIEIEAFQTDKELIIHTLEGDMKANVGDYIITGVEGEQYPCKPNIFEKTYEIATNNADVVPRSEVENLQKQLDDKQFRCDSCDRIALTSAGHKHCIKQAKQEVARQIFEEIEEFIESDKGKVIYEYNGNDWFARENAKTLEFCFNIGTGNAKNALRDLLDELKKKYIGKDTDVPTKIGE